MKNISVIYTNPAGFKPKYWIHLRNIEYTVHTPPDVTTLVLSPEQVDALEFALSAARQDKDYSEVKR